MTSASNWENDIKELLPYSCSICSMSFVRKYFLERHYVLEHSEKKPQNLKKVDISSSNCPNPSLQLHIDDIINKCKNEDSQTEENELTINTGQNVDTVSNNNTILELNIDDIIRKCQSEIAEMEQSGELIKNIEVENVDKIKILPHSCFICSKAYVRPSSLLKHYKLHTKELGENLEHLEEQREKYLLNKTKNTDSKLDLIAILKECENGNTNQNHDNDPECSNQNYRNLNTNDIVIQNVYSNGIKVEPMDPTEIAQYLESTNVNNLNNQSYEEDSLIENEIILCHECGDTFSTAIEFKSHSRMHNSDEYFIDSTNIKVECIDPNYVNQFLDPTQHLNKQTHENNLAENETHLCHECGDTFSTSAEFKSHVCTHQDSFISSIKVECIDPGYNDQFIDSTIIQSYEAVNETHERNDTSFTSEYKKHCDMDRGNKDGSNNTNESSLSENHQKSNNSSQNENLSTLDLEHNSLNQRESYIKLEYGINFSSASFPAASQWQANYHSGLSMESDALPYKEHISFPFMGSDMKILPHSCFICSKSFSRENSLLKHYKEHPQELGINLEHLEIVREKYKVKKTHPSCLPSFLLNFSLFSKCEECQKSIYKTDFDKHKQFCHLKKVFVCNICYEGFENPHLLVRHKRTHGIAIKINDDEENYERKSCKIMKKEKVKKIGLKETEKVGRKKQHKRCPDKLKNICVLDLLIRQGDGIIHTCKICNETFKNKKDLDAHAKSAHLGNLPFECNVCNEGFSIKSDLREHKRQHIMKVDHMCIVCKESFQLKSELLAHNKTCKRKLEVTEPP